MNDAEYARVFSLAAEALMDRLGLDAEGRARYGYTIYTLEAHLCYRREAHEGQPLAVEVALLNHDAKRLPFTSRRRRARSRSRPARPAAGWPGSPCRRAWR
ncbi:hypothetical protein C1H69_02215 [Billgrantia endophytica]|uniref:Thioesterase domain-containing protein n=1 Tax=Billgrantia endophytica TaxID=2033802 RepID=A0A2N7UAX7_9GAMM|nr:hypothetical protein C1H69_02215 [Halomonas endophytica]